MEETKDLFRTSIETIKKFQDPSGAYVASPNFDNYQYSWLRDGSFTAYAMDSVGEFESSRAFHRWVSAAIMRYRDKIDVLEEKLKSGEPIRDRDFLHTRYRLDGTEDPEETGWGNFQMDGYGTWLWAVSQHMNLSDELDFYAEVRESIHTILRYLSLVYALPCYDLWEENPDFLHTYSLGAVYGGVNSILKLSSVISEDLQEYGALAQEVCEFIHNFAVDGGMFVKYLARKNGQYRPVASSSVDASLIGLCTPYGLVASQDERFATTMRTIEAWLVNKEGGVYRYQTDTYYGGGEWVLLAGWLGWHYALNGQPEKARQLVDWIETVADSDLLLAEQISENLLFPNYFSQWEKDWGPVAKPLLWSHAMYLIACTAIEHAAEEENQDEKSPYSI